MRLLVSSPEDRFTIADAIKEAINKFIPSKMTKSKCHLPWISPAIKRLMNKRDRTYKKAKRTGKAQHLGAYRQLRNSTTKRIRELHVKYVEEVMGGIAPSPEGSTSAGIKRAWSSIKLLRSESLGIPALF